MEGERPSLRNPSFGGWVSGTGHLALVIWLLSGWGLTHDPLDFQVTPITTISGEEYAQLVAATTPDAQTEAVEVTAPPPDETPPEAAPAPDDPAPEPPPQVPPETPPDEAPPPPAPDPVPQPAEVLDAPPEMAAPEAWVPPPAPESARRPQARPAPRVAAEAVAPPPPEADVAPVVQDEVAPEAETPAVVEEPSRAAAPEEAATEIVTEAETPSGAPEVALRPHSRPARPAPQAETPSQTTPATPRAEPETPRQAAAETPAAPDNAGVEDALAAALAGAAAEPAPAGNPGPPMTGAERDAFRLAVSGCWAVDPGSEAALVTITVGFELDRQGRVAGDVRLVNSSGGSPGAVDSAFQSARRAILRCQSTTGYQLPADKYDQWRDVEMTFDPSGMRMR
ncbi:MAG: hypothetical protein H3C51_05635 [Rubellimicrobium sp.]|nr:hypothetical protein [Rubellimicrobium sp.]